MFGIGMPELLIILGLALVILGPKKLPGMAKGLGRAMREFKKATEDMKEELREETTELGEIKDTIMGEVDRATEPEETGEESIESEEEVETAVEDTGTEKAVEDTENRDVVDETDGRKESIEDAEKSPPG